MAADAPRLTKELAEALITSGPNWDSGSQRWELKAALNAIATGQTINIDRALWEQVVGAINKHSGEFIGGQYTATLQEQLAAAEKVKLP